MTKTVGQPTRGKPVIFLGRITVGTPCRVDVCLQRNRPYMYDDDDYPLVCTVRLGYQFIREKNL